MEYVSDAIAAVSFLRERPSHAVALVSTVTHVAATTTSPVLVILLADAPLKGHLKLFYIYAAVVVYGYIV